MYRTFKVEGINTAIRNKNILLRLCDSYTPLIPIWFCANSNNTTITNVYNGNIKSSFNKIFNNNISSETFCDSTYIKGCTRIVYVYSVCVIIDFDIIPRDTSASCF